MKKVTEWTDQDRNFVASALRKLAEDAPPIQASWIRELALAIDND